MKILIVEDSIGLVNVYQNIINNIINKNIPEEDVDIISIVNYNEYLYFKNMEFDLAIFDWNIVGGTSESIIAEAISKIDFSCFITGYANTKRVRELSKEYKIPVISKPSTELEILQLLEKAIKIIYNGNKTLVSEFI